MVWPFENQMYSNTLSHTHKHTHISHKNHCYITFALVVVTRRWNERVKAKKCNSPSKPHMDIPFLTLQESVASSSHSHGGLLIRCVILAYPFVKRQMYACDSLVCHKSNYSFDICIFSSSFSNKFLYFEIKHGQKIQRYKKYLPNCTGSVLDQ